MRTVFAFSDTLAGGKPGKIERFWRTLKREVLSGNSFSDQESWQRCFDDWRNLYNFVRPHQALDGLTPSKRYLRSLRTYVKPDLREQIGQPDSIYRAVRSKGHINFKGKISKNIL